jgi:hypothetical protein
MQTLGAFEIIESLRIAIVGHGIKNAIHVQEYNRPHGYYSTDKSPGRSRLKVPDLDFREMSGSAAS